MIRLFTGLAIPPGVAGELAGLQTGLVGARWIAPENFHITLTFIGSVPENLAEEADHQLRHGGFSRCRPFAVRLAGVGSFGHGRPKAVWAGVEVAGEPAASDAAADDLAGLKAASDAAVARAGLTVPSRKFTPHVTLARIRRGDALPVADYLSRQAIVRTAAFAVYEVMLFSARAPHGGGPYVIECRYPLR